MSKDLKYELPTFYQNLNWVCRVKCKLNRNEKAKQAAS